MKAEGYYEIVNWEVYQHYKKRRPPWFKVYQDLFTSATWVGADDASRVLMIASMMLASRTQNKIPADPEYIRRIAYLNNNPDFSHLLATGFIRFVDASNTLASNASETETEKEERGSPPPPFQKTEGPRLNPDPLPLARPGHPSDPPQPPGDAGKGTSSEADHGGHPRATSPQVSPPLAGQPPSFCADPGGESPRACSDPAGVRPPSKIHVVDKTPGAPSLCSHEKASRPDEHPPGPGGGRDMPTRLSEVLPAVMTPFKADSNELVEVQELQQYFANVWGTEISPVLPVGDNLTRILEVLRHPAGGWDVCKAAIRGHHKIASKDGAQHGREFRLVFPPLRIGGKQQTARVDLDRVFEYARKGRKPQPRREEKPKEPEISREEAEAAAKKGIAKVRKAINQNGDQEEVG